MKKLIFILLFIILHVSFNIEHCEAQWEPDVRLTNAPEYSSTSNNNAWCVAANGNIVHAVWYDHRKGNYDIYYKRSTDGGINWGTDICLTNNTADSWHPSIAVSGSLVHVVWSDNRHSDWEIYYKRSTDNGINWGDDVRLTNYFLSVYPSIAVSGSLVHVVWFDPHDGNTEIYYKRSTDDGTNWGADTRLTNDTANSEYPSIAVSGTLVNVVWDDSRDGNYEIYYKRSTDGGINWGTDICLTNNTADSWHPSIAVSGSLMHVVWIDNRDGNYEIYYIRSANGGINWGVETRLTNNTANSWFPSVAISGSIVHIVWNDFRDGNSEIYYVRSTNGGINWEANTRLTNNIATSLYPSIAISGSLVHVVWYDLRDGNEEIYYKRNPTGNVGIKNILTEIPSEFLLEQNYPNPFNAVTSIKFKVTSEGGRSQKTEVRLKVYDLNGREIKTLVNEELNPGTYEVRFDAGNLSSGIYFYRMETEKFTETKKLILLK